MFLILSFEEIDALAELSKDHSPAVYAVYLALRRHADRSGVCFPGYRRIMECSGLESKATVSSALKVLEKSGLIERKKKGRRNVYRFKICTISVQKLNYIGSNFEPYRFKNCTLTISKNYNQLTRTRELGHSSPSFQPRSDEYRPPLVMDP